MTTRQVERLQRAINRRGRTRGVQVAVDGILGPQTEAAIERLGYLLGVSPHTGSRQAHRRCRRVIRHPARRTPAELARARQRMRAYRAEHAAPRIVRLQAPMTNNQGPLGAPREAVGHYTAGPRDTSDAHALSLLRQYNQQHRDQGWGGIAYHLAIATSGTLILCRPTGWKGCHVAMQNSGRIGIVVLGGPGQRMTAAQRATLRWLRAHAHTSAMPASHRAPAPLTRLLVHKDLNATACPGDYEKDYKA